MLHDKSGRYNRGNRSRSGPCSPRCPISPSLVSPGNASSLLADFQDMSMQHSGYNTRSAKKKLAQSPESRQADSEQYCGSASSQVATRSRTSAQSEPKRMVDTAEGHDSRSVRSSAAGMDSNDMESGGSASVRAMDCEGESHIPADICEPAQGSGSKKQERQNPVTKLTIRLLDTYQSINEKYYAKHRVDYASRNHGYDDENNDYIVKVGDLINDRYEIQLRPNGKSPVLGKGSFGQVVHAIDRVAKPPMPVAIKIIKNHKHWHEQAKSEVELLRKLRHMPHIEGIRWVDYANCVKLFDDFVFRSHYCLVFELLPFTLFDLLKLSEFKGVSLSLVRKFAKNLLHTLDCLRDPGVDVIHCDLKPENIMLVKPNEYRLKVIDFGSSCSSKKQPFTYIQSRFYRSPEVLLCRPYNHAIDMWSLGCILVEMHIGKPLFNGENEVKQMCKICDVLGCPPVHMIQEAGQKSKVKDIFKISASECQIVVNDATMPVRSRRLRDIIRKPVPTGTSSHPADTDELYIQFEDLILRMLALDPERRISPTDALCHPFFGVSSRSSQSQIGMAASAAASGSVAAVSGSVESMQISPRPEPLKVDQEVQTDRASGASKGLSSRPR
mmetsp:Transcript_28101/g.74174  ORF Transcript_28101/g.74174 Transcript_28101/m.74174 type:complete len:612 (-) Transcript_28101:638-2473(-)